MTNSQTQWWTPVEADDETLVADAFDGAPRTRRAVRERPGRQKREQRRRTVVVVSVLAALLAGAGYVVASLFTSEGDGILATASVDDFTGPGHGSVVVTVEPGDTGAAIGRTLVDAGVVANVDVFARAYAANADATTIQPGAYRLLLEIPSADAVDALLDPASKASMTLTIPEGLNAEQILDKISEKTLVPRDELAAAAADPAAIGLPNEAGGKVEGWLFPATYDVPPDASATEILQKMTAKTVEVLKAANVPGDQWKAVLTKASLVEREAKLDVDRPKIARAIENRLDKEQPLSIDSAVAYGLGTTGAISIEDTQDPDNAYNTYVRIGLPPTPIASPGQASLDAVLHPADGDWLFWVTVNLDTGETLFASTYDEHQENVQLLRDWQAANEQ